MTKIPFIDSTSHIHSSLNHINLSIKQINNTTSIHIQCSTVFFAVYETDIPISGSQCTYNHTYLGTYSHSTMTFLPLFTISFHI